MVTPDELDAKFRKEGRFQSMASLNCDEPIFFHYTSAAGALGILQSGTLWCTSVHQMNDSTELKHGFQRAQQIAYQQSSAFDPDRRQRFLGELRRQLERVERVHLFATSFSEAEDLLSQWRGYASPGGYSLGFSATAIARLAAQQGLLVGEVAYTNEAQERLLAPIISQLIADCGDDDLTGDERGSLDGIFWKHTRAILRVSPLIKHPSFSEEREWRLYSDPAVDHTSRYDFVARRDEILPLIKVNLSSGTRDSRGRQLRDICFRTFQAGPGANLTERSDSLGMAIAKYDVFWVLSHPSRAPYRG